MRSQSHASGEDPHVPVAAPPEPERKAKPKPALRRSRVRLVRPIEAVHRFWQRVSEGLEAEELWKQFHSEAHASYELYRKEVDWAPREKERGFARSFRLTKELFWAVLSKLSPARRVLLLLALGLSSFGAVSFTSGNTSISIDLRGLGFFVVLLLLGLELADRVTMKRDLEIAREIQHWLVPESPPRVPGLDIAFTTRPANTVAGDYYDAFFRDPAEKRLLLAVPATSATARSCFFSAGSRKKAS